MLVTSVATVGAAAAVVAANAVVVAAAAVAFNNCFREANTNFSSSGYVRHK